MSDGLDRNGDVVLTILARIAALEAEVGELRALVTPLARKVTAIFPDPPEAYEPWHWHAEHAECALDGRVRSKRRAVDFHGVITGHDTSRSYQWLVRWENGEFEWCRDGELRVPLAPGPVEPSSNVPGSPDGSTAKGAP